MLQADFVHLHAHSHYSLLDGANRIDRLLARTRELGMDALALTDHGNLFGAVEFYNAAKKAGIKPIIGYEAYVAPQNRLDKSSGVRESPQHLLLLARNRTGYQNLLKLSSIAFREGFYYKPRIDKEVLTAYAEGLICINGHIGTELATLVLKDDLQGAIDAANWYRELFGKEHFYVELQDHGMPDQKRLMPQLIQLANQLELRYLATNDVHYLKREDSRAHDALLCINTGKLVSDTQRMKMDCDQYYLKSPDEMRAIFADCPDAISTTVEVAEMCQLDLDFTERHAPAFKTPTDETSEQYFHRLAYDGLQRRYPEITDTIKQRLNYELEVICSKGFAGYFLIVHDFMQEAARRGIPCGPRGSGVSTLVGYALGISEVDPLQYGLFFERFMDPERDEMPDIDIDICQNGRAEIIDYVRKKYGHVAQIITFGTMKARAVVRDVGRVFGMSVADVDTLAKMIPNELNITLDAAFERDMDLKKRYEQEPQVREVIDIAKRLEGLARHASVHAAGVVIADKPLDHFVPLYKSVDSDDMITQFDGPTVEKVGLLKMDFLGLRTLTTLERANQLVEQIKGTKIDLEGLDLADQAVFDLFARGNTQGIFQFESGGMRDLLMKMRPNHINDLIAANALYRPGPMILINDYVDRKHGASYESPHPIIRELLDETYGIIVYQEQVSRLVNRIGNIPLARAFRLAKAISKKKVEAIEAEREPFMEGALANGIDGGDAESIFNLILRFGGYGFNKSHSTRYAIIAYQTAYMKRFHPVEFMAALLTFEMGSTDKVVEYMEECRRMEIAVLAPDINQSTTDFTPVYPEGTDKPGVIRFGLGAVKGVGEKAVENIIQAREEGKPFDSLYDFAERVDLRLANRSVVEALIKCGAFDSTDAHRAQLMAGVDAALSIGGSAQADRRNGQLNLFKQLQSSEPTSTENNPLPDVPPWPQEQQLKHEKSVLGFYVSSHPLSDHADLLKRYTTATTQAMSRLSDGTAVTVGGMITRVRFTYTKTGRTAGQKMAIVTLEDLHGQIDAVIFPDALVQFEDLVAPEQMVFLKGRVDFRREQPSIKTDELIAITAAPHILTTAVHLKLDCSTLDDVRIAQLRDLVGTFHGGCPLFLEMAMGDGTVVLVRANGGMAVTPSAEFQRNGDALLGNGSVQMLAPPPLPLAAPPHDEIELPASPVAAD